MSERARKYAEQHSWREIARRTAAIYEKAMADMTQPVHFVR
jgi:hypothetical protein